MLLNQRLGVFVRDLHPGAEQPGPIAEPGLPSCLELLSISLHSMHGTEAGQMQRCVRVSSEQLTSYREQMPARESAQPPLHLCKTQAERWGREHLGTITTVCAVLPGNQVHELSTEGTPHPAQQRGAEHQRTWSTCWGSLACRAQPEHYCDRKSSVLSSLNKLFLQIKNEKPSSSHSSFLHYSSSGAAGRDSTRVGGAEVAALLGTPGQLVGRCQGSPGEGSNAGRAARKANAKGTGAGNFQGFC